MVAGLVVLGFLGTSACATTGQAPNAASSVPPNAATPTTTSPTSSSAPSGAGPDASPSTSVDESTAPVSEGAPGPSPTTVSEDSTLACAGVGPSFPVDALAGPRIDRDDLAATAAGTALAAHFAEDDADGELAAFAPDAFVVLSSNDDAAVFGGTDKGEVVSSFELERRDGEWKLIGWGGCRPNRVRADLQAATWQVVGTDQGGRVLQLEVEGGECVDDREETRTRIVDVDVEETPGEVVVVVWAEQPPPPDGDLCAGLGVVVPWTVTLAEPLGARTLVDGGTVPPTTGCRQEVGGAGC